MKRTLLLLFLLVAFGAYVYVEKILFFEVPPVTTKQQAPVKTAKPVTRETKKPALSRLPAFFPSGPMVWIHSKDLGKIIKQIKNSNFYKQAVEYKIFHPSKLFPVSFETKAKEKSVFSKISTQLEEKVLMDLLGQEIGFALYPGDKAGQENYLFAAQISSITKIQEKLQRVKDSLLGDKVTVSKNNYKEKTIITYKNQEQKQSFHYVITKNHILGSSSDILLKKGIDLMDGKESDRFINSEGFNSLFKTSDLSMAGLFFTDMEKIVANISNNVIPSKKVSPKEVDDIRRLWQSFKYSGVTFKIQNGLEIRTISTINKEKADKKWLQAINIEPRKLKSLNFMPGSVVTYGAIIFEPSYSFEQIIKKVEEKKGAKKTFEEFFSKYTGVNPGKDIIPFIGNEIFFSVSVQDKTASLQIPGITIGLEIKDREKIKNLLNKIQINLAKSSKQKSFPGESYEGYDINFLPISIPIPVQPVYSIVDNFLLFSLNQKEIKRLIDASKKKIPSLEKNKKYISAKIPAKNLGMIFINAPPLWDGLSEAIIKAPAGLSPDQPGRAETGIKSLDLMRAVQSFNSVIVHENNQFNSRTFIAIKDIPKIRASKELVAFLEKTRQKATTPITTSKPGQAKVSYAYVYDPAGKRDPFRSLITAKKRALTAKKQIKDEKLAQFMEDIRSIKPIILHLYNKIRRKDPAMYKKMKSYVRFFKNQKAIKKASSEERYKILFDYKRLSDIVRKGFHDSILGPLQSGQYSSLKLTGVIWGAKGNIALIETPNGKGYSVKVNDLVGPNYGVVKKIEQDKIIVVEQYVNYIEKIIEKRQKIKLSKSGESI